MKNTAHKDDSVFKTELNNSRKNKKQKLLEAKKKEKSFQ
jgi:hypothetical protein